MVTTIGTSSDMAKLVENFILLEHDAPRMILNYVD